MSAWAYLAMAICAEVMATTALKASDGFTRLLPSIVVVIGYGIAFWGLAKCLRSIPIGIAYAIWSGAGIVAISLIAWLVFRQSLDAAAIVGMTLIIAGVMVIHLFSRSTAG